MVFKKNNFNRYNETYYKFLMYCLATKRVLLGGHTMNKRFCVNVKFNYKHLAWKLEKKS